jgi:hypothetical protein
VSFCKSFPFVLFAGYQKRCSEVVKKQLGFCLDESSAIKVSINPRLPLLVLRQWDIMKKAVITAVAKLRTYVQHPKKITSRED